MSFEKLIAINVNKDIEDREGLKYLSWSPAWETFKKTYPEATYKITMFDGKPYCYDENLGYMVMTEVTANGETLPMWLCVMDSKNKAMKKESYEYTTKYGKKSVEVASMFDINKTIMRCFVKNLAMFGLGLYIYKGEDLPTVEDTNTETKEENKSSLVEQIRNCKTDEELKKIYQNNKTEITANKDLLDLISAKGNTLKAAKKDAA